MGAYLNGKRLFYHYKPVHQIVHAPVRYMIQDTQFTNLGNWGMLYDGTLTNITYDTDGSAKLDGTSGLINTHVKHTDLNPNGFSIGAIFTGEDLTNYRGLIGTSTETTNDLRLFAFATSTELANFINYDSINNANSINRSVFADGKFHYVLWIINNKNLKIYVDGVKKVDGTFNITFSPSSAELLFGRAVNVAGTRYWKGKVRMIEIYTEQALTETEIQENYSYCVENNLLK